MCFPSRVLKRVLSPVNWYLVGTCVCSSVLLDLLLFMQCCYSKK